MIFSRRGREERTKRLLAEFLGSAEGRDALVQHAPEMFARTELALVREKIRYDLHDLVKKELELFKSDLQSLYRTANEHFGAFLRSEEASRLMIAHVGEALARGVLVSVLNDAEQRLKALAAEEIATQTARAELAVRADAAISAAALRGRILQDVANAAAELADEVRQQFSVCKGAIMETVHDHLPRILQDEVARHVRSGPLFSRPTSNREIAAACGISIREVKRRRKYGEF